MDVVLGIAAKSLDAGYHLARALHGPTGWAWQESVGLQPFQAPNSSAPEAGAHLLLSHDRRTTYLLVATNATAEELLRAAACTSQQQQQQQQPLQPQPSPDGDPVAAVALVPPLQRLQQQHDAAVNIQLLQLFLACDAVVVVLPTGQGLGLAGSAGSGCPLSGATEWMSRLRLLQGAKRSLQQSLCGGGGSQLPRGRGRGRGRPPQSPISPQPTGGGGAEGGAGVDGLAQLRAWCGRTRPPVLVFVSPSDPHKDSSPAVPSSSSSSLPPRTASASRSTAQRSGAATAAAAAAAAADPRDVNWLLRNLLKRCRPVPLSGSSSDQQPSPQLCSFDPAALVLEPGPLALEPAAVQAAVLATLLGPEEDLGGHAAADFTSCTIAGRKGDGMQRLRETLEAALAVAEAEDGSGLKGEAADGGGGEAGAVAAVRCFAVGWRAAAGMLCDAALAAWREAIAQPLEWMPPSMEAGGALRQAPTPGHAASTAHGRTRPRAPPATATLQNQPAASASPGAQPSLESAAAWLASGGGGGGLVARLASELCREAAEAALRQYGTVTPPRYPERVHVAAVAAAVAALRAAAPPGPAAGAAAARLRAACEEAWRRPGAGRRQCSALSATGRPCTRPPHDASEAHSSENTCWVAATSTGSTVVALPDPFDLQMANASPHMDDGGRVATSLPPSQQQQPSASAMASPVPAAAGGRGKGGKKAGGAAAVAAAVAGGGGEPGAGGGAAVAHPPSSPPRHQQQQQSLPAHSRHLVVAVAQAADGSTRQCALGPWVTVTRLGPASSYNERRGLTNQPGLNGCCLYPLALHLEADAGAGHRAGSASRAPRGASRPTIPRNEPAGSDAAAAAGGGGSDSDAGVVLDEQSFPSLAEAAAAAQAGRQQVAPAGLGGPMGRRRAGGGRQQAAAGAGSSKAGGGVGAAADAAGAASKERERLAKAWPYPHSSAAAGNRAAGGSGDGLRAPAEAGAGAGPAARGRRGRGGAGSGSGADGSDTIAFPPLANAKDVRKVFVSYEYETLDGRRFLATPQQLAAAAADRVPTHPAAATPQATAASPAAPTAPQPANPNQRKGPKHASGPAVAAAAAAATTAGSTGGGGGGSGAASFLLQHDAPLYLQPPPGLQPEPTGPAAQDGAPVWDPTPRRPGGLAQLRRIFVVTPPSVSGEPLLAARPTVQFRVLKPPQLPRDAAAAAGLQQPQAAGAGGDADDDGNGQEQRVRAADLVSGPGPAAAVVHVSLARPVPLPPDSLVVISLPYVYGLPAEWLGWGQGMGDGASGGDSAATRGAWPAIRSGSTSEAVPAAAEAATAGSQGTGGGGGNGQAQGGAEAQHGPLLPLVQLDERTPYEARLLAGSALFPVPASQA